MIAAMKTGIEYGMMDIGAFGAFVIGLILVGVLVEVVELIGRLFKTAYRKNKKKPD